LTRWITLAAALTAVLIVTLEPYRVETAPVDDLPEVALKGFEGYTIESERVGVHYRGESLEKRGRDYRIVRPAFERIVRGRKESLQADLGRLRE
jgi:hypothetical protein